jgi:hypothetical protein
MSGSWTISTFNATRADRRTGARLTLKNAHNADRLKHPYAGPVAPDEIVAEPGDVVGRAVAWLQNEG